MNRFLLPALAAALQLGCSRGARTEPPGAAAPAPRAAAEDAARALDAGAARDAATTTAAAADVGPPDAAPTWNEFAAFLPLPGDGDPGRFLWRPGGILLENGEETFRWFAPGAPSARRAERRFMLDSCRVSDWGPAIAMDCRMHNDAWLMRFADPSHGEDDPDDVAGERDDDSGAGLEAFSDDGVHACGLHGAMPHQLYAYRHGSPPSHWVCPVPTLALPRAHAMHGASALLISADRGRDPGVAAAVYDVERRRGVPLALADAPAGADPVAVEGGFLPDGQVYLTLAARTAAAPVAWIAYGPPAAPLAVRALPAGAVVAALVDPHTVLAAARDRAWFSYDGGAYWSPVRGSPRAASNTDTVTLRCSRGHCLVNPLGLVRLHTTTEPARAEPPAADAGALDDAAAPAPAALDAAVVSHPAPDAAPPPPRPERPMPSELAPEDADYEDPAQGRGWSNRCFLHLRASRLPAAQAACERGLEAGPTPATRGALLYNLGAIAEAAGRREVAARRYRESLEARPDNAPTRAALERVAR